MAIVNGKVTRSEDGDVSVSVHKGCGTPPPPFPHLRCAWLILLSGCSEAGSAAAPLAAAQEADLEAGHVDGLCILQGGQEGRQAVHDASQPDKAGLLLLPRASGSEGAARKAKAEPRAAIIAASAGCQGKPATCCRRFRRAAWSSPRATWRIRCVCRRRRARAAPSGRRADSRTAADYRRRS